jgi:hypothetical protein
MRFANNFNPEWGYLAPAPSFARTMRTVLVAAAIGASAGGAVVFSLVVHPAAEEYSVAARTLVQPAAQVQAMTQSSAPQQRIQAGARTAIDNVPAMLSSAHAASLGASDSSTSSTGQGPASIARLAEAPAATDVAPPATLNDTVAAAAEPIPAQKKVAKKPRVTWPSGTPGEQAHAGTRGPLALLRPFSGQSPTGVYQSGAYQWRGEY